MSKTLTVLEIVFYTVVAVLIYRFVFNPQIVTGGSRANASTCPARWDYINGMCLPGYSTTCSAFNPSKMTSVTASCNLARTCGTDWPGMCA